MSSDPSTSCEFLSLEEIRRLHKKIAPYVPPTPLTRSEHLSQKYNTPIYLKLENLNISGSFKVRGAAAALLSCPLGELQKKGVVVASAGNHGQGVAYIGRSLKVPVMVFMPENTPLIKIEATKSLGAHIQLVGQNFHEAEQAMLTWQQKNQKIMIHAFAQKEVMLGQGTIGLEILEKIPELGTVMAPVGGGGLISGLSVVVKSLNPSTKVVGVQSQSCCPVTRMMASLGKAFCTLDRDCEGEESSMGGDVSLADGIAVKTPGRLNQEVIREYVDVMMCVGESSVAGAIMELLERDHVAVEGAGAASVAALKALFERYPEKRGKSVVCVISGGNIDAAVLSRITRKGLVYSGRMVRLKLTLKDSPGALAKLLGKIADTQANLYHIHHSREFSRHGVKEARVILDLEVAHKEHGLEIKELLKESGYLVEGVLP